MMGFIIWSIVGAAFVGLGIYCTGSKRETAVGFWANAKVFPVENISGYNKAMGKLWCAYGIIFMLLGIPLLEGQNSSLILLSVLGCVAENITAMVVYTIVIEKKYRKK